MILGISPLQEQQMLLRAEPSLQLPIFVFKVTQVVREAHILLYTGKVTDTGFAKLLFVSSDVALV